MKATIFLFALTGSAFGALIERASPTCAADNCARAVTGTRLGPSAVASHMADCSSFQAVTTFLGFGIVTSATATPMYATACSGTARYASACACWGVPVSTTTIVATSDDNGQDDLFY